MSIEIRDLAPLLQVFDMPTSVHFYSDLLGFDLVSHSPFYAEGLFHWAMLRRNDVTLMLNTAYDEGERPSVPEATRVAAHADTALYFGCPDVDAAYRYIIGKGIQLKPPKVAPYGMKQLNVHDPDGYLVVLQWPS